VEGAVDRKDWDLLYEVAEEEIEEVERGIKLLEKDFFNQKRPKFRVAGEEGGSKKEKLAMALTLIEGISSAKQDLIDFVGALKELREVDARARQLSLEIEREVYQAELRKEKLKSASARLRELIEVYREQIDKVMKIVNGLPAETEKDFERKLNLIDRSNKLLGDLSNLVLKFLAL